jgi:prefoldin beta subunit
MSSIEQLPPNVQEKIQRLQQLQNTMQQLLIQKQRIEIEITESTKALETLQETNQDSKIFKSVGAVLVERPLDKVTKELQERVEFQEMRMKVIKRQEDKTKERLTEIQTNLQKELGITQE